MWWYRKKGTSILYWAAKDSVYLSRSFFPTSIYFLFLCSFYLFCLKIDQSWLLNVMWTVCAVYRIMLLKQNYMKETFLLRVPSTFLLLYDGLNKIFSLWFQWKFIELFFFSVFWYWSFIRFFQIFLTLSISLLPYSLFTCFTFGITSWITPAAQKFACSFVAFVRFLSIWLAKTNVRFIHFFIFCCFFRLLFLILLFGILSQFQFSDFSNKFLFWFCFCCCSSENHYDRKLEQLQKSVRWLVVYCESVGSSANTYFGHWLQG